MGSMSVAELVQVLYESKNDAWRDDAAELLARAPDRAEAEAALIEAIQSSAIDDSLRRTCAESLAEIWIERGSVSESAFAELQGMPRDVVKTFLRAANISFKE